MTPEQLKHLALAMCLDGMSKFWIHLVLDEGPHGKRIGARLWATMPERYL